ncbi:MAG: ABC transporter permease [Candidatus Cohnella colombiensis]|uniref:ABC transporter permease n=1 Tax=Candidatus Cohnella colombiensis TaxID=3121368 RepID=A0AA95EV27_9BACL|nr:MAG: ABC transporter permease [Cohnella sp.]
MLKLIKLELAKHKIRGNILGGFIASFAILAFIILVNFDDEAFVSYKEVMLVSNTFASITFTIFAATLLSKFIIDEFKSKTITVLFMYPISRKKLIAAKITIVLVFTFLFILVSNALSLTGFYIANHYLDFIQDELTITMLREHVIRTIASAVIASFISLVPLYFGMRKYSIPTTIVSAIVITSILNSSSGTDFNLSSIVYIPATIAIIGALIGYRTVRDIDHKDIT